MTQNNFKSQIGKLTPQKRRGVAEVISTLLLVAITVAGAVVLTSFIDESFVSGSLAVTSGTDTTIKTIRLLAYDTRNGDDLMDPIYNLDNTNPPVVDSFLCRESCTVSDTNPDNGGSDFMVIQIENRGINSIFMKDVSLDNVRHSWDADTIGVDVDGSFASPAGGSYPRDGTYSILPGNGVDLAQTTREIPGGAAVNLLIKLHSNDATIPDIQLSKTMRVQLNIGESSLADFLIETGDAR
jgi:flagellin-like protein